jgi:hypothetical protein
MEHSYIIQPHHPSGMLYEAFCQFSKEHANASFFQSDAFFRMIRQQEHTEAILLLALARTPAPGTTGKEAEPAGKDASHAEEESLFPGGALLFRGQPIRDPSADLDPDPNQDPDPDSDPDSPAANPQLPTSNNQQPIPNTQNPTTNSQPPTSNNQQPIPNTQNPTTNSQPPTANPQPPTPNNQQPIANNQQPITNSQPPTPKEGEIPGVGRIVGSVLAVTFCAKTGWGRRMRRRTVIFGGPLLADGTRLDQETRLRNLLNAVDRHVKSRSLSLHIFSFRSWNMLLPVLRELGFMEGGNLNALSAWKAVLGKNAETLSSQETSEVDHARLEKQLETCVARHGALYKVNRRVLQFFLKLFSSRL